MMTDYDWDALIGEAYRQGNEQQARTLMESMALARDAKLTYPELRAAVTA